MSDKFNFRRKMTEALELPREVVLNLPLISLTGNEEMTIENYKGIVEYGNEKIRINTASGIVRIQGRTLTIKHLNGESIIVSGSIESIEFIV